MPNEVDEFLGDVKGEEKGDPFVVEPDPLDVKSDSTVDKVVVEDKGDKPLPFHKDPKVQRFIEKEIGKRMKDIKPAEAKEQPSTEDELTETLTEIIGNDTPQKVAAIKKFRTQLGQLEERGAEKALSELRQRAEDERAEEAKAVEEISNAFDAIEEEFDVDLTSNTTLAKKERSDFVDFIKRISPKDENGDVLQYPDFTETWKLFQSTKKPVDNKKAKDLASRSIGRSSDAGSTPTTGKTWKDVDKIFAKL